MWVSFARPRLFRRVIGELASSWHVSVLFERDRGESSSCAITRVIYIYIFSLLLFKSNASFSKQKYKRFECVLESFRFAIRKFEGIVQLCDGNYFVFLGVIFFFIYIKEFPIQYFLSSIKRFSSIKLFFRILLLILLWVI